MKGLPFRFSWALLLAASVAGGQEAQSPVNSPAAASAPAQRASYTIPSGTTVPLTLEQSVNTKNAHAGNKVFCRTTFPIAIENHIVIPPGTYVQGVISDVRRAGRVKGRAEVLLHFTTMILPNGYTFQLPGAVENAPDADTARTKDPEGTIQHEGQKGKDAGTIAKGAGYGTLIGAASSGSLKGAGVGGGLGAAVGTAIALMTRGDDIRLERGSTVNMVFERPVTIEAAKIR
jgi:type IV secretion system protein VirB10